MANLAKRLRVPSSIVGLILVFFMLTGGSCSSPVDQINSDQAATHFTFVDLSGSGACKTFYYSSKSSVLECNYGSPLTFWYDQNDPQGRLIACTQNLDKNGYMSKVNDCEYHLPPKDVPPNAKFVAVNVGANSETQTAWLTDTGYMLCEHDLNWLDFTQIGDIVCGNFKIPRGLSNTAQLMSFNSGYHIESTEVWQDRGSLWKCDTTAYKRPDGTYQAFKYNNRTQLCIPFSLPDGAKPSGAGTLTFVGLNADLDSPWEFFYTTTYQGKGNYVVRCIYDYSDPQDTSDPQWIETYGNVQSCDWWYGLKDSDLPNAA